MDFYDKKKLNYILKKYNFRFKKSLGQNFLINKSIIQKIANLYDNTYNIIEIGPGIGHLTTILSKNVKKVIAIEIDQELVNIFNDLHNNNKNINIIKDDVLKLDLFEIYKKNFNNEKVSLCANLPYYITSKLILKLVNITFLEDITLMLQKEVVERLTANVGKKLYGSFSVYINYFFEVKKILEVNANNFMPEPKIDSAVINMKHNKRFFPCNEKIFLELVFVSFLYKRKKMINSIIYSKKFNIDKNNLEKIFNMINISKNVRAEELYIDDFVKISNLLSEYLNTNIIK